MIVSLRRKVTMWTTWHKLLTEALEENGESRADIVHSTFECEASAKLFDNVFGGMNGTPDFYAWTAKHVYFADDYDGMASVCWVPRNP